ncbi:MAG: hypothetical protein GX947_02490 [Tissierellia bacterium]|nr:hypothetical protein [Tissierellia bacterium]
MRDNSRILLRGYIGNNDYQKAKAPISKGWNSNDYEGLTKNNIKSHLDDGGWIGWRVPLGKIVVDIDDTDMGKVLYEVLQNTDLKYMAIKTPRGYQFIFNAPPQSKKIKGSVKENTALLVKVDYRAGGKNQIVLPSENTDGRYWIEGNEEYLTQELSEIPYFLYPIKANGQLSDLECGNRNNFFFEHARRLFGQGFSEEEVMEICCIQNEYFSSEPLELEELETIVSSANSYHEKEDKKKKKSEAVDYTAASKEIIECFNLKYTDEFGFVYWDKTHWEIAHDKHIDSLIMKFAIDNRLSFTVGLQKNFLLNLKTLAFVPKFETNYRQISFKNGTLCLDTGDFFEGMFFVGNNHFHVMPYNYDLNADCLKYKKVLDYVFEGDSERIALTQEMLGYIFMDSNPYEVAFLLYGDGGTGKSTVSRVLNGLLPKTAISHLSLADLNSEFKLASLSGKLLNYSTEQPSSTTDSELFKSLVSGESVEANRKYKDSFPLENKAKFVFCSNHLPKTGDKSEGTSRRWIIIPFNQKVEERNVNIHSELAEEMSGIFNFALEGYRRVKSKGFSESEQSELAQKEFIEENNKTVIFCSEYLTECEGSFEYNEDIYKYVKEFMEENGYKNVSMVTVGRTIKKLFPKAEQCKKQKGGVRKHGWKNIKILAEGTHF